MSYEEINTRRQKKGLLMNLCTGCEKATVVPPSQERAWCEQCDEICNSLPQRNSRTLQTKSAMRRNAAYEDTVWTEDEEPGVVKAKKEPTKETMIEIEPERRFCTSCNREKQPTAFDERMKTCRTCLETRRLKSATDANNLKEASRMLGPNPPQGNRSGLRRESPIEIPSPSEVVRNSELDRKGKVVRKEYLDRHTKDRHRISTDAFDSPWETSRRRVIVRAPLEGVGGQGSMQPKPVRDINNAISKSRALPPQPNPKQKNETTALDKELKEVADKATMKALKRKLDEAEKAEKKAKSTLAATQATKKACMGRIKELNKQEAQEHTATVEAKKLIDDLKLRIVQQER